MEPKPPTPPRAGSSPAKGKYEPRFIRVSVDPEAKSQFIMTKDVEAWRDRLQWDDRVTAPFNRVDVPCLPGQGMPREQLNKTPRREWGQMSSRQAHTTSARWGTGVGSALSRQAAPSVSSRAQFHAPPPWRRANSTPRMAPLTGQRIKGQAPSRGNTTRLWGENGRDDCNAANWCSQTAGDYQRNGSPRPTARSRVFVFDEAFVPELESNSYKALTARIEQHHTSIMAPPQTPSSPAHREGALMGRAHAWNLDRGWRPTSSGALFG